MKKLGHVSKQAAFLCLFCIGISAFFPVYGSNKEFPRYFSGFSSAPVVLQPLMDRPYQTWLFPETPHPFFSVSATVRGAVFYRCGMDK